jgi:pentatricopeptide repeat protein
MVADRSRGTLTLARLLAAQGHWEDAIQIYRQMLVDEPERRDIARALSEAEQQFYAAQRPRSRGAADLLAEWFDLLLQQDRLRRLKRLKKLL